MDTWTIRNITQNISLGPVLRHNLQASSHILILRGSAVMEDQAKQASLDHTGLTANPASLPAEKLNIQASICVNIFILQFLLSIGRP